MEKLFNLIQTPALNHVVYGLFIQRRNVTLSFKILGTDTSEVPKPPILLVHNIIGNKKQWEGIGKTILRVTRRPVVAIDLRNHGDSPHVNSHKYTDQALDVLELIEKLGSQRASLIGHGLGGKTAMSVALIAPDKVAGLLVVDISPITTPTEYNQYILKILNAMQKVDFKPKSTVSNAKNTAKGQLIETIGNDFFMQAALSNIVLKKDDTIGWTCNLDVLVNQYKYWASFPKELKRKKYNGPTMFIGGELSDLIPREDIPDIELIFPKAVVVYVPNVGTQRTSRRSQNLLGARYFICKNSYLHS